MLCKLVYLQCSILMVGLSSNASALCALLYFVFYVLCLRRTVVISRLGVNCSQKEDLMLWMKQLSLGYVANMGFP